MINKGDSFKWEPANQEDNDTDHDDDDKEASQSDVEDRGDDNDDNKSAEEKLLDSIAVSVFVIIGWVGQKPRSK